MSNQYHLLVEAPDANLSQRMRQLNAYRSGGYLQKQIDDYFRLHYSQISRLVETGAGSSLVFCMSPFLNYGTNHYHLLVETADANLSQWMHQLNGIFTQSMDRNH